MRRKTLNLALVGGFVACAFGGFGLGLAWATPGQAVTPILLAGPVTPVPFHVGGETETREIEITTKGGWETRVIHSRIAPGGHTGWHSHPGPVFGMITAGTMTKYEAGDPTPAVDPAGTGFGDDGGDVHIAGNATATCSSSPST